MPGYDLSKSDLSHLAPKYKCVSCKRLLRDAMQTGCGHFYCSSCLDNLAGNATRCLVDNMLIFQDKDFPVFPDNFMRREIMQLVVQCTHVELGCKWKGEVRHLEVHHDRDCPAFPTVCPRCNKDGIQRAKMAEHQDPLRGDCDGAPRPCTSQRTATGGSERKASAHRSQVSGLGTQLHSMSLLLKETQELLRDIASVMRRTPGLVSGNSSFLADYKSAISDILTAVQGVTEEHRELRNDVIRQSERIAFLERRWARIENRENLLGYNPNSQMGVTNSVEVDETGSSGQENSSNVDAIRQQNNGLKSQLRALQEAIRRLEMKIESHENMVALQNARRDAALAQLRQQQMSSYDGALLWKIDDCARRKNDAVSRKQTSFYSPCFYTSRHGYKMCARIYLNGDGMGKGTHISVFFVVMRGQFDALLRWPFKRKVTIMLLDQDNVEHVIDTFRPDPNSSSFQRPRREMNVASGCPLFCPLYDLSKHAYVRDDVMFMKIIVDTSDL